jgi:hypothetical protein
VRRSLLTVLALIAIAAPACGYADPYATNPGPVANESPLPGSPSPGVDDFNDGTGLPQITYPDGLKYIDLTVGTGGLAHSGDTLTVHYTGWLSSTGVKFDSSRDRGTPFDVVIGKGNVIPGWDEGIPGMRVGGKRKLLIPSVLAYGTAGQTDTTTGTTIIPPNADLVFDVELIGVVPGPTPSPVPTPTPSPSPSPSPSASPTK